MNVRMPAEDRRELILQAAMRAFADGGYHGTSTDTVAREAGVSQPYVVRMFGTKLELFLAVFDRACRRIQDTFAAVLDDDFDGSSEEDQLRLGHSYTALVEDQDFLRVMNHGFATGSVPEIGALARERMGQIFETLKRTGWNDEEIRDFIAHGMLLNVLLGMGALASPVKGSLGELVQACFADRT